MNYTITLTFGDRAENHHGMQILGKEAKEGFKYEDLVRIDNWFEKKSCKGGIIDLRDILEEPYKSQASEAYLLIVRNGISAILNDEEADSLCKEQVDLPKDTKAFMKGRVVNKRARYNLCFNHEGQEPVYEEGKGTIVSFSQVPILNKVRESFVDIIGKKGKDLVVEGNYYYDTKQCYIGYHGDSERRKVIGLRLGESMPFHYQWHQASEPIGSRLEIILNEGDLYFMSEKAVGYDWLKKKIPTLRHAAGFPKVLKLDNKNVVGVEV